MSLSAALSPEGPAPLRVTERLLMVEAIAAQIRVSQAAECIRFYRDGALDLVKDIDEQLADPATAESPKRYSLMVARTNKTRELDHKILEFIHGRARLFLNVMRGHVGLYRLVRAKPLWLKRCFNLEAGDALSAVRLAVVALVDDWQPFVKDIPSVARLDAFKEADCDLKREGDKVVEIADWLDEVAKIAVRGTPDPKQESKAPEYVRGIGSDFVVYCDEQGRPNLRDIYPAIPRPLPTPECKALVPYVDWPERMRERTAVACMFDEIYGQHRWGFFFKDKGGLVPEAAGVGLLFEDGRGPVYFSAGREIVPFVKGNPDAPGLLWVHESKALIVHEGWQDQQRLAEQERHRRDMTERFVVDMFNGKRFRWDFCYVDSRQPARGGRIEGHPDPERGWVMRHAGREVVPFHPTHRGLDLSDFKAERAPIEADVVPRHCSKTATHASRVEETARVVSAIEAMCVALFRSG